MVIYECQQRSTPISLCRRDTIRLCRRVVSCPLYVVPLAYRPGQVRKLDSPHTCVQAVKVM